MLLGFLVTIDRSCPEFGKKIKNKISVWDESTKLIADNERRADI